MFLRPAAISRANQCPFCAEFHGGLVGMLYGKKVANAISGGRHHEIEDRDLRHIVAWASAAGSSAAR